MSRIGGGRRVERDQSGANQFYEVCGSTVEEEQLLVNIDSGANRIIIKWVHLFNQLDRMRKSALRTANRHASLNWRDRKVQQREISPRGLNGSNFGLETESNRLQDHFWR